MGFNNKRGCKWKVDINGHMAFNVNYCKANDNLIDTHKC